MLVGMGKRIRCCSHAPFPMHEDSRRSLENAMEKARCETRCSRSAPAARQRRVRSRAILLSQQAFLVQHHREQSVVTRHVGDRSEMEVPTGLAAGHSPFAATRPDGSVTDPRMRDELWHDCMSKRMSSGTVTLQGDARLG